MSGLHSGAAGSRAGQDADAALDEDRIAADLLIRLNDPGKVLAAQVIVNEDCVVAGRAWFDACMQQAAARLKLPEPAIAWTTEEGGRAGTGAKIVRVDAAAAVVLAAERSALNFLGLLAAVATRARSISEQAAPVPVYDTRKTLPLLRAAQKHAAAAGGMHSNRADLSEAAIIKDNHIKAAGSIGAAYERALKNCPAEKIQVEVDSPKQLEEALAASIRRIMLDNFSPAQAEEAVKLAAGRAELEVSGNIDESNVAAYAKTGVDRISSSAATKGAGCVDLSLKIL